MATIGEAIDIIRGMLKAFTDDTLFTDEYLYSFLNKARLTILKRELGKNGLSKWNYQEYCMGLEKAKSHDCECVKVGCDILKTKYKIPKPLRYMGNEVIEIYDLGYCEIAPTTVKNQKDDMLDPIKGSSVMYTINNDKASFFNTDLNMKGVIVRTISEDPTEWESVTMCDEQGEETENECYDVLNDPFPIDGDLLLVVYELTFNLLAKTLNIREDLTNDAQEQIKI